MINNVIYNILYQFLNIIIPLITAPYISRVMTPNEIGIYSYSNSLCGIFAVFMLLGISNYGSRTVAMTAKKGKQELSHTFWELFAMQMVTSVLGLLVYSIVLLFSAEEYKTGLYAQIFYLLSVMLDISWYFTGTGQIKKAVMRGSIIKIIQTLAIFIYVKQPSDLVVYILIMSVGTMLGNVALWVMVRKQISFELISFKHIVPHIKPNLILFIPLLASSVFVYTDKIMLGVIASSADLGLYEYAEKIVRIPLTIISAIGTVMMPYISGLLSESDYSSCQKHFSLSMRYISLLAIAMNFGLLAIGPELADVYLGEGFSESGKLIQIMSCIIPFSAFANIIRTQWLIPRGEDKKYAISIVGGALVNLCLNALLIPNMGSIGAAIGTIGAEMMVFACHVFAVRKKLRLGRHFSQWGCSLIYGCAMLFLIEVIISFFASILIKLVVAVTIGILLFTTIVLLRICKDNLDISVKRKMKRDEQQ